ncbi:DNA/RNA polymerases superfamily protein [Tanacetum coccineum]
MAETYYGDGGDEVFWEHAAITDNKEAQRDDESCGRLPLCANVEDGKHTEISVLNEDVLCGLKIRLCVPNEHALHETVMTKLIVLQLLFIPGKIEHKRSSGCYSRLEIPMWKWDEFPWIYSYPFERTDIVSKLAEIFRQEIVRLHGTPTSIVSDRDPKFTSHFWKGLQKAWGTRLKFSTTFHPQTDGQSERTIQTLEDMLRACALEWTVVGMNILCLWSLRNNNRSELIEITNEKVAVAK